MQIISLKSKFLMGVFEQNTYVLIQGKEAVIVDAGAEIEDVKKAVGKAKVLGILTTHLHFDHMWNIEKYVTEFDTDVFVTKGAEKAFVDAGLNASTMVHDLVFEIPQKNIKYYAKKLKLGKFDFEVINTPGHTADSVCLLTQNNLFSGDTLFVDGVGRTDLETGNAFELKDSLKRIRELDFDKVFSGHYEPFDRQTALAVIDFYI